MSEQQTSNAIYHVAENRPTHAVGTITPTETGNRSTPPKPISGFETEGTPFDRSHGISLDIGGADIPENITPAYGKWQETGAWRNMETELKEKHRGKVMVLEYGYNKDANPSNYHTQKTRFNGETTRDSTADRLQHWIHPAIPTEFKIWVVEDKALEKVAHEAIIDYAKPTANRAEVINSLMRQLPSEPTYVHPIIDMPQEDKKFWAMDMIKAVSRHLYETYEEATKAEKKKEKLSTTTTSRPKRVAAGGTAPIPLLQYGEWAQKQDHPKKVLKDITRRMTKAQFGRSIWRLDRFNNLTVQAIESALYTDGRANKKVKR